MTRRLSASVSSTAATSSLRSRSSSAERCAAAYRGVALTLADQAEHERAHERLAFVGNPRVGAFRQPRDRALHAAGLAIGREGERVVLPLLPELEQGGGQQRQRARLALHVVDEGVGQLRLHPEPHPGCGQLDRAPQLGRLQRPDQHVVPAQKLGELGIRGEAAVEVGAQRDDDDRAAVRIGGRTGEGVREGGALFLGAAGGQELLELVDREEEASVGRERLERLGERILRTRDEHAAQLLHRPLPRAQQQPPPAAAARQHSTRQRREQAGAEHRRLAAARRADDPEEARADQPRDELGHEPLAAEEVVGVDGLEARQPLERADSLGRHAGRGDGARERPRVLARRLQVEHLVRQLGLDLAQVAPAGRGARGHVEQRAARLVDGDAERGPRQLPAARVPLGRILRQRSRDHPVERGRQLRPRGTHGRRLGVEMRKHDREVGVSPERWLPDQALVEQAAERVHVRPAVELAAGDLLRCDVVDGPHQVAVLAARGLARRPAS